MAWWTWMVLGVLLLVVEMATPGGLFAVFFGIAAFVIAPVAAAGASATLQWALYTVVSLGLLVTLRSFLSRRLAARGAPPVENLVGEQAILIEDLPADGEGKAELRGTPWTARAVGGGALPKGRRCRVERVDGLTLWLRAE
ncbi:MAG TPA: NfeD family protein [Anaeromyxobacteraceae bacterium]|nr:NfeD family protein [Anaeromyxobacteraceae bacterium]